MILFLQRYPCRAFELSHIVRHKVGQIAVFGIAPARFDRIQFRAVGRQPLELDVLHPRVCDSLGGRTMDGPTVQTNDQRVLELLAKLFDEIHNVVSTNILFVDLKGGADATTFGRQGNRTNHAQPIVTKPGLLQRCFSDGGPSASIQRLQTKARFIDKNNGCAMPASFFLMRGQSCSRQRSTAWASCSRATRLGFWGLNPRSCSTRERWPGSYCTRNFLRTTSATREQVHRSVRYPAANGPATRISTNSCFCCLESFDVPPGWGLAARASTPPDFQAFFQRFTLERWTPSKPATVRRDFPAWKYSAARRRRASSSAALPGVLINNHTVLAPGRVHSPRKDQ